MLPNSDGWDKIIQTTDSGFAVLMNSVDSGRVNFILIKTDQSGNIQWSYKYHLDTSTVYPWASSFLQLPDHSFVIAAHGDSAQLIFWRISPVGDIDFIKKYHADSARTFFGAFVNNPDVSILSDGNILFAASVASPIQGLLTGVCNWILKTDSQGNFLWSVFFRKDSIHFGPNFRKIVSSVNGGFYGFDNFIALDTSGNVSTDVFKGDGNGNILWLKQLGGDFHALCISATSDDNLLIGAIPQLIMKIDSTGSIRWTRRASIYGWPIKFTEQSNGNYLLVRNSFPLRAVVLDTSGNPLGQSTSIQPVLSNDYINDVAPASDGGFVAFSEKDSTGFVIIKVDSLLNSGCNEYNTFDSFSTISTIDSSGIYQEAATMTTIDITAAAYKTTVNFGLIDACLYDFVTSEEEKSESNISPNPASTFITISSPGKPINQIEIFNTVGQIVQCEKFKEKINVQTIQIKLLPGLYIVVMRDSENYTFNKLIVR